MQTGGMKVGEFQKALGVNSRGYNILLQQSGKLKGANSNTYFATFKFSRTGKIKTLKPRRKRSRRKIKRMTMYQPSR
jgi:hypothetical protein